MVKYWDRLKPEMDAKKMDITKFSEAMGISFQAVAKVRDGGSFGTKNNIKAAELLGLSSDWLATGKGEKTPPFNYLPADIEWINQHIGEDEHEAAARFASSDSGKALMLLTEERARRQPIDPENSVAQALQAIVSQLSPLDSGTRETIANLAHEAMCKPEKTAANMAAINALMRFATGKIETAAFSQTTKAT